ncbi:MAG: DUF4262 domain-containing protein [Bacteroidota bacterium]
MVLDRAIAKTNADKKLFDNIERYDCHVISVHNRADETGPLFSYSIGLTETVGCAELLIVGLPSKLAHAMINWYRDDAKAGSKFFAGQFYSGFLEGFVTRHTEMPDWLAILIIASSLFLIIFYYILYPNQLKRKANHATIH